MSKVDSRVARDQLRARLASMGLDKELASFLDAAVSNGNDAEIASVLQQITEAQDALPRLVARLAAADADSAVPDVSTPDVVSNTLAADFGKLMGRMQVPGVDLKAIVESQRKDMEAL